MNPEEHIHSLTYYVGEEFHVDIVKCGDITEVWLWHTFFPHKILCAEWVSTDSDLIMQIVEEHLKEYKDNYEKIMEREYETCEYN